MAIEKRTLTYYDWSDIQAFLCEELGIPVDKFRDYHEVVGGEYKDFWHVWLSIDDERLYNGSYTTTYLDDPDHTIDWMKEKYGDWVEDLRAPLHALAEEVGPELVISHSW